MKKTFTLSMALTAGALLLFSCGKKEDNATSVEPVETSNMDAGPEDNDIRLPEARPESESKWMPVRTIKVKNIGPLGKVFNDSNYLQLQAAQELGIEPISDLSSAYFTRRPLVKISSNENYRIDSLRHSLPYLVPEAARLLDDIGKNFKDSLAKRGGDSYLVKVTSLLRTPQTVSRLRRVNVNATDSSTHQFGTTFDLSYVNFYCLDENRQISQGDLKNLLAEVLQDLRSNGRCYVKYEYKTGCFHVTALR